jgi:hypothetical protein
VNTGTDANRLTVPEVVIKLALERLPPP